MSSTLYYFHLYCDYNDKNMERIMKRYLSGILRPLVSGKDRK